MKILMIVIITTLSMSALANDEYNKTCAKRYIEGSKSLVKTAQEFNNAQIDQVEFASRVTLAGSAINALRVYCINENRAASECVDKTKKVYKKIRKKMYVRQVLQKELNQVEVSELDLVPLTKGAVSGFFNRLLRGEEENLCTLGE